MNHSDDLTLNAMLEMAVSQYGNRIFAEFYGHPNLSIAYRELGAQVEKHRRLLAHQKGAIAFYLPNSVPWIVYFLATVCNGQTALVVDFHMEVPFILKQLVSSKPAAIITTAEAAEVLRNDWNGKEFGFPLPEIILVDIYAPLIKEPRREETVLPRATPASVALIVYTSGSTGKPKGTVITHEALVNSVRENAAQLHPDYLVSELCFIPFSHIAGISASLLCGIFWGAKLVLIDSLLPHTVISAIQQHDVQSMVTVPIVLESLCKKIIASIAELHFIQRLLVNFLRCFTLAMCRLSPNFGHALGRRLFKPLHKALGEHLAIFYPCGARLPKKLAEVLYSVGYHVYDSYGLSETVGCIAMNRAMMKHLGAVGEINRNVHVKIEEPDMHGVGEVVVQSNHLMKEYYNNKEQTALCMVDGWLKTGDLGYVDQNNYLHILGRNKEVIITPQGQKVYPGDLEEFFMDLSLFEGISAFGLSLDEKEHVAICVQISPNRAGEEEKIRRLLAKKNEQLPPFMRANFIFIQTEKLPLKNGKVVRAELARKYEKTERDPLC